MKSPPIQYTDDEARQLVEAFIADDTPVIQPRRKAPRKPRSTTAP